MTDVGSREYYSFREQRERALAAAATDPAVAAIHFEFATRYADLIANLPQHPQIGAHGDQRPKRDAIAESLSVWGFEQPMGHYG